MFMEVTRRRNPGLLAAALRLHRERQVPPNTYILDLDALKANAGLLAEAARRTGLNLYFMTKQLNRNPQVMQAVAAAGIPKGVAVDIDCARAFREAGIALGHAGHLVQVPVAHLDQMLAWQPEVITVFSVEKARQVSQAAGALGRRQDVLIRLAGDSFFPGQEGGITQEELPTAARAIAALPGVRVAGVTAFPCLLAEGDHPVPTANLGLLHRGAELLREMGMPVWQLNAPSLTCVATLPLLQAAGATHGEPGHALTGTTPLHAVADQPEIPALVYLSEVSHLYGGRAYCFGGGSYPRGQMRQALVGEDLRPAAVQGPVPEHIDYYLSLSGETARVGEPVLMAFRTQAFTARANLALVEGVASGQIRLAGLYDRCNRPFTLD